MKHDHELRSPLLNMNTVTFAGAVACVTLYCTTVGTHILMRRDTVMLEEKRRTWVGVLQRRRRRREGEKVAGKDILFVFFDFLIPYIEVAEQVKWSISLFSNDS